MPLFFNLSPASGVPRLHPAPSGDGHFSVGGSQWHGWASCDGTAPPSPPTRRWRSPRAPCSRTPSRPTVTRPTRPSSTTAGSGSSTARTASTAGSTSRSTSSTARSSPTAATCPSTSSRTVRPCWPSTSAPARPGHQPRHLRARAQTAGSPCRPAAGDLQLAGGTLASVDAETGGVWAARVDTVTGRSLVTAVDRQADPLEEVGEGRRPRREPVRHRGGDLGDRGHRHLRGAPGRRLRRPPHRGAARGAGAPTAVTTVGDTVVTLDAAPGTLAVLGGASRRRPRGQRPAAARPGRRRGAGRRSRQPDERRPRDRRDDRGDRGRDGQRPAEPVRLGACQYAAWSGGVGARRGAVRRRRGRPSAPSAARAASLAFRVNRGEIVLNDGTSGTVWDVGGPEPQKIDNWERLHRDEEGRGRGEEEPGADGRRPASAQRQARPYGVRAGRTTVLHPLDNDSAPEGRLLEHRRGRPAQRRAQVEISPDGQTLVLQMPDRRAARDVRVLHRTTGATLSATRASRSGVRGDGENGRREPARGLQAPTYKVPPAGAARSPCSGRLARRHRRRHRWCSTPPRRSAARRPVRWPAPPPTGGSASPRPATSSEGPAGARGVRGHRRPLRAGPTSMSFQVQAPKDQKSFAPTRRARRRARRGRSADQDPAPAQRPARLGPRRTPTPTCRSVASCRSRRVRRSAPTRERQHDVHREPSAGTFFLDYDAATATHRSTAGHDPRRRQARPEATATRSPCPTPLTVYGQAAAIVDVLANDLDPAGGLLAVQQAVADDRRRAGRGDHRRPLVAGLRPPGRRSRPTRRLLTYTISNGSRSGVRVRSGRPAPGAQGQHPRHGRRPGHVVRAGTSVTAPVLDNDVSPSGDRLSLRRRRRRRIARAPWRSSRRST